MAGSLEKRGENWRMVYFRGRDENGKRIRYTRLIKGSKSQAEKALAKFVTEIESGLVGDGENMFFRDLCDEWMKEYAKERLSPKSYVDYSKIIEQRFLGRSVDNTIKKLGAFSTIEGVKKEFKEFIEFEKEQSQRVTKDKIEMPSKLFKEELSL